MEMMLGPVPNVFLYGGARSGKSYVIALYIIIRSLQIPGLRTLVARFRFNQAKSSIWMQTIMEILDKMQCRGYWKENRSDWYITFNNGSEIWLGGFDEKERTEKLLGHEYSMVYFNEISQISYDAVELGLTRLAKRTEGFVNKAMYDCNPPSPLHWSHRLFIEGIDPRDVKRPLERRSDYFSMLMNPADNRENLSDDYMIRLGTLSERAKRRMLYGEWVKPEGAVYEEFAERHIISKEKVPPIERYCVGIDFGLQCAGVLVGWAGDRAYIIDDYGALGFTAQMLNNEITRKWGNLQWIAWCDPSGGERLFEIFNSSEANNAVEPGIDFIQTLIHNDNFYVVDTCRGVLSEIWDYRRDEKGKIVKENDHYLDTVRYAIFSERGTPVQIFIK